MKKNKDITVVIVAGGFGTRLRPLTETIPKPMVKVGDLPILHHILNWFKFYGFEKYVFCLCYLPDKIQSYFQDGSKFGVGIEYVYEDVSVPLGSAGAVGLARSLVKGPFIVTYADILRNLDLTDFVTKHFENGGDVTINLHKSSSNPPRSTVIYDPNTYQIKQFIEKPTAQQIPTQNWSNGSLYMFNPDIFFQIVPGKSLDFGHDIFPQLINQNKKIFCLPTEGYFIDIGDLDKLQQAEYDIKSGKFKTYDNN